MLVAAERSTRRRRPRRAPNDEANVPDLGSLRRWRVPVASRESAVAFGGASLSAEAWADGLVHHGGGRWPRVAIDVADNACGRTLWVGPVRQR
jgi:hypothetical protein